MNTPAILGIPFDANSSFLRGPAQAPPLIRDAFHSDASNYWSETGVDLGAEDAYVDSGDLDLSEANAFGEIETAVEQLIEQNLRPICLGGDHSITYPILRAFSRKYPQLTIVHFDAHPDLYDEFQGSKLSHACPFARIMEGGLASRLIQIGIRTLNAHQREQAARFKVEQYEMENLPARDVLQLQGPVYLSFDVDVLDPAFAPGISHREPGGLTVREAIHFLHAITGQIVGADIVEYNPVRDVDHLTAMVCAKLLKEIAGKIIRSE
jgi:arginase